LPFRLFLKLNSKTDDINNLLLTKQEAMQHPYPPNIEIIQEMESHHSSSSIHQSPQAIPEIKNSESYDQFSHSIRFNFHFPDLFFLIIYE